MRAVDFTPRATFSSLDTSLSADISLFLSTGTVTTTTLENLYADRKPPTFNSMISSSDKGFHLVSFYVASAALAADDAVGKTPRTKAWYDKFDDELARFYTAPGALLPLLLLSYQSHLLTIRSSSLTFVAEQFYTFSLTELPHLSLTVALTDGRARSGNRQSLTINATDPSLAPEDRDQEKTAAFLAWTSKVQQELGHSSLPWPEALQLLRDAEARGMWYQGVRADATIRVKYPEVPGAFSPFRRPHRFRLTFFYSPPLPPFAPCDSSSYDLRWRLRLILP